MAIGSPPKRKKITIRAPGNNKKLAVGLRNPENEITNCMVISRSTKTINNWLSEVAKTTRLETSKTSRSRKTWNSCLPPEDGSVSDDSQHFTLRRRNQLQKLLLGFETLATLCSHLFAGPGLDCRLSFMIVFESSYPRALAEGQTCNLQLLNHSSPIPGSPEKFDGSP